MLNSYKFAALSLLVLVSACNKEEIQRSIQTELPNQENNIIKVSQPGIGCWFWVEQEFKPEGYKPFIDLYARHTNFRLLTTSIRHDSWVDDPAVHEQVKKAATYARSNGMGIVFDLDVRHARESFREQYPHEMQELVRLRETDLNDKGTVSMVIEGIKLGDHYTFGPTPDYDSYASRLLRAWSYNDSGDLPEDITDRCRVEYADGSKLQVSIACDAKDRGRKVCFMAAFTLFTPDVFSPHLPDFEKKLLEQYADVPLAGACKDEWGFPGRFDPSFKDLWYSESMAKEYASRRPGHSLSMDMLLMYKGNGGRQSERSAAINHYMQMVWQRCSEVENLYYESVKEVFGDQAMVMTHPTWVPFPDKREIFKNGLDWWAVKRDLAQTDETTPYCVRTALAKKWNSPLWYNMYYNKSIEVYKTELWRSVLGGGRINYHQVFPFPDWLHNPDWNKALLKDSLMQAESRVQLLNYISTKPIDCPVAVIFGHAAAMNWNGTGFGDVGLQITDKLWESGFYADLIPSSEIASGALEIGEDGSMHYGEQRYAGVVLYNPEYELQTTAEFFRKVFEGGNTRLFRVGSWTKDFNGDDFNGNEALPASMKPMDGSAVADSILSQLKDAGYVPYTASTTNNAHYGSSMVPDVSGHMRLIDGTVIHASGRSNVMGDPINKTITIDGNKVSFDCIGIAAVRFDEDGNLEAMAAGGLRLFKCGDIEISMPVRADIALWKDKNEVWKGVLQGYDGELPENLKVLCKRWTRLKVPESAI